MHLDSHSFTTKGNGVHMVICPIARVIHCTGCPFFKFCPAKTLLGDYGKNVAESTRKVTASEKQEPEAKSPDDLTSTQEL